MFNAEMYICQNITKRTGRKKIKGITNTPEFWVICKQFEVIKSIADKAIFNPNIIF